MKWFGSDRGTPMQRECPRIPAPVGTPCLRCTEPIQEGDAGIIDAGGATFHFACHIRGLVGSVQHQQKRCSCFGFPEPDAADFNARQDAEAALRFFAKSVGRGNWYE